MEIYFDNSATTRPFKEAVAAVRHFMEIEYYNPSALYGPAVDAARELMLVKKAFAKPFSCDIQEIYFNSGGTEGNNTVIFGAMKAGRQKRHAITCIAEHSSVLEPFRELERLGYRVDYVGTDEYGRVRPEEVFSKLRKDTGIVSIMHVNNESGAINDIDAIAQGVKQRVPDCIVHSDGVQAFPKLAVPAKGILDAYTISGHKFHSPRGSGMMYLKKDAKIAPLLYGGHQEDGRRPGTENLAAIAGMGVALKVYLENHDVFLRNMVSVKQRLWKNIGYIPGTRLNGPPIDLGAPHILSCGFEGVNAETLVHALEEEGVYAGTGSACSSRKTEPNRILAAMGVPEEYAKGTLRFSFCYQNTTAQADRAAEIIEKSVKRIRRFVKR